MILARNIPVKSSFSKLINKVKVCFTIFEGIFRICFSRKTENAILNQKQCFWQMFYEIMSKFFVLIKSMSLFVFKCVVFLSVFAGSSLL